MPVIGTGDPPPFGSAAFSAWVFPPVSTTVVVAGCLLCGLGWLRARRLGKPLPAGRVIAAVAALVATVLALNSSIAVYATQLFWVHMIQHLLLIMIVPPLLVWAYPWTLEVEDGPAAVLPRAGRILLNPLVTVPFYAAVVVLTHLTGFQQAALEHPALHGMEIAVYVLTGYVLFLPLVEPGAGRNHIPDLIRFVILAAAMGVDTLAGVALMMTAHPLAPGYAATHPGAGPDALADQQAAGAIMWFGGDGIMMILMVVVALMWGASHTHRSSGLGDWLEGVRRRELLRDIHIEPSADDTGDVDIDQMMLDAYNARLADLHRRDTGGT